MSNNVFRNGRVHVKKSMCLTCIFRPDNRMRLAAGRVEQMVEKAKQKDSSIICHSTLRTKKNAVCRGFYENHSTMTLHMAQAMGVIKEDP